MKNVLNLKKIFVLVFIAFAGISCSDDESSTPAPTDNTITGIASRNADLSILVKALTKAGLASTLQGTGPFTVFAPTNQAFIDAGYTSEVIDAIPTSGIPGLKEILLNHVVSGAVQSTGLQNNSYIKTLAKGSASATNTLSMFVSTSAGVKLNGIATVTTANVIASNGVVHVVDKVITLPTIATHAIANTNFSTLVSLLARPDQPNYAEALSGTAGSPYTVFAPINAAFTALNTELAGSGGIAGVSANNITKVLQYHVVGGANVLSSTLTEGQVVTPLLAQTFTIQLTGSAKIKDINNRISNIIAVDVQCSNGVIHALDKVLLPNL
jgi:uncharacterized surface protein with fasciclin (FAS1) repeats